MYVETLWQAIVSSVPSLKRPARCYGWIALAGGLLLLQIASRGQAQVNTPPDREAVVAWLEHQESLVHSIECTFESVASASSPENMSRVVEVCNKYGRDPERYFYTQQMADDRTFTAHWYREGPKEKWEMFQKAEDWLSHLAKGPYRQMAFDGKVCSLLDRHKDGQLVGEMKPFKDSHLRVNLPDPFSFLFEYSRTPYSEIVARGTDLRISTVSRAGRAHTEVSVKYEPEKMTFILLFDNEHRLAERQLIRHSKEGSGIIEKHTFSDYGRHTSESGEPFWFPRRAVWRHYIGPLPEDPPAEYLSYTMRVKDIKFNVDIPDDTFTIQFPPGTKIWDGLTGAGWIDHPGEKSMKQKLAELIDNSRSQAKPSKSAPTTAGQPSDANIEGVGVPTSQVPVAQLQRGRTSNWWAVCGTILGLLLLSAACIYCVIRVKGTTGTS